MDISFRNPLFVFLIKALVLYLAWTAFYELWLHPNREIELLVVSNITWIANGIIELLGFELIVPEFLYEYEKTVGIDGTHGLFVSDSCSGVTLMALFTGFIIAYPGKLLRKLVFIPIGIVTIHFINILRIIGLCIVLKYYPGYFEFNHHYTFTLVVYAYVFLLWILWTNKYAGNLQKAK